MTGTTGLSSELLAPTAALLRAHIAVDAAITRKAAQPAGLDPAIADLLLRLSLAEGSSLRGVEIGRQLMVNPTKVSRLVDRAESQGLVERLPDPTDRRAQRVTLTRAGQEAVTAFEPLLASTLEAMLDQTFSKSELTQIIRLLNLLTQSATTIAQAP